MGTLDERLDAADKGEPAPSSAPGLPAPDPAAVAAELERQKWIDAALRYGAIGRAMVPANVAPHWTDERLRAVGVELANCARHYGWTFTQAINHPLLALLAAAFPLAWPLIEPYAMPMIKELGGRKEKDVTPPRDNAKAGADQPPPPPPPDTKPPKVAPIG